MTNDDNHGHHATDLDSSFVASPCLLLLHLFVIVIAFKLFCLQKPGTTQVETCRTNKTPASRVRACVTEEREGKPFASHPAALGQWPLLSTQSNGGGRFINMIYVAPALNVVSVALPEPFIARLPSINRFSVLICNL